MCDHNFHGMNLVSLMHGKTKIYPPTLGDVHRIVIPKLKEAIDNDGTKLYPFLTKDPNVRRMFEHR